jgi:hypothetical protein
MAIVPVSKRFRAVVDDDDIELVAHHRWAIHHRRNTKYASTQINGHIVYLHRLLMNPPDGLQVDHIDGDGLNNQRSNLRLATNAQNVAAQIRVPANGYRGVCRKHPGWRAEVGCGPGRIRGPTRASKVVAAQDYDRIAFEKYGEFARLNFPTKHDGE